MNSGGKISHFFLIRKKVIQEIRERMVENFRGSPWMSFHFYILPTRPLMRPDLVRPS